MRKTVLQKIDEGYYNPGVNKPTQPKKKCPVCDAELEKYNKDREHFYQVLKECNKQFKKDALKECGFANHKNASKIYNYASIKCEDEYGVYRLRAELAILEELSEIFN